MSISIPNNTYNFCDSFLKLIFSWLQWRCHSIFLIFTICTANCAIIIYIRLWWHKWRNNWNEAILLFVFTVLNWSISLIFWHPITSFISWSIMIIYHEHESQQFGWELVPPSLCYQLSGEVHSSGLKTTQSGHSWTYLSAVELHVRWIVPFLLVKGNSLFQSEFVSTLSSHSETSSSSPSLPVSLPAKISSQSLWAVELSFFFFKLILLVEECGPIECNRELFICYVPPPLCGCAGAEFRRQCLMTRCRCSHYREQKVREKKPANTEQTASLDTDCDNVLSSLRVCGGGR